MKVDSPAIWGTQYCSANQSRRVEWLCLGTNRGCEGVDSHMQFLLVRAANSSVVGKPEVIWAFQHFVARSRNGLLGSWLDWYREVGQFQDQMRGKMHGSMVVFGINPTELS